MRWFRSSRARQRQSQIAALQSRVQPDAASPDPTLLPEPPKTDWPEIQNRHPGWWQVHRIELRDGAKRLVLIAQMRTEDEAFRVAALQRSQVRISKWDSKERPYESFSVPLVIVTGTVSRADE